ncbi:MAG: hypothetical protein ABW137_30820 [Mycobacterium sp.]
MGPVSASVPAANKRISDRKVVDAANLADPSALPGRETMDAENLPRIRQGRGATLGVSNTTNQGAIQMMNHIRTLVLAAASAAVVAAGLGVAAVGVAGTASADEICWDLQYDGTTDYYYC